MANQKNLDPHKFKKGQSGNPKGRPPMPNLKQAIADILSNKKDDKTALDAIITALFNKAVKGDVRAIQELLDRGFGKASQTINANIGMNKKEIEGIFPDE